MRRPTALVVVGWTVVAAIVAAGQLLDSRDPPDAAPGDSLPALPSAIPRPVPEPAVPVLSGDSAASFARPHPAPVRRAPTASAPAGRALPRPFEGVRGFVSPLLTPRLTLPRVLTPEFGGLAGLVTKARPGQPVKVVLTAYCLRGNTRRGNPVRAGIVAVDPRIFPLAGQVDLFADGRYLGRFLIDDTGGKVLGTHIDIWTPECADARKFGRRPGIATLRADDRP